MNRRWDMKDGQVRRLRDKRERMSKSRFLELSLIDLVVAHYEATVKCVPFAQIQLWNMGLK